MFLSNLFYFTLFVWHCNGFYASQYTTHRLEEICDPFGNKKVIGFLYDKPKVFTFNSTISKEFDCHLELEFNSGQGFFVFIDQLQIDVQPACRTDYIMFGWDFAFITAQKTAPICTSLPPKDFTKDDGEGELGFPHEKSYSKRLYNKMKNEIDFWVQLKAKNNERKEIKITVTPIRSCNQYRNDNLRQCPGSNECISKSLFCDGKVNCRLAQDEDRNECSKLVEDEGFFTSPIGIPIIIILAVVIPTGIVIFLLTGISICRKYLRLGSRNEEDASNNSFPTLLGSHPRRQERQNSDSPSAYERHGGAPLAALVLEERDPARGEQDQSSPPSAPPPYSEIYKDAPPKYSEIIPENSEESEEK